MDLRQELRSVAIQATDRLTRMEGIFKAAGLHRLAVLVLMACALPAFAAKRVTVERLEQILVAAHGKSDGKVSDQLLDLQLSERVSTGRLMAWEAGLPGRRSREALIALSDASAFLDLPASDIPDLPAPDSARQHRILSQAARYASNFIDHLPDLQATRDTTYFEDTPPQETIDPDILNGVKLSAYVPLRVVGRSSVEVTYREGREVATAGGKNQASDRMTSTGEFGPILAVVMGDALQGSILWGHWEQGAAGPQAVMRYSVAQAKSRYKVMSACEAKAAWLSPGYHGEIAIDAGSGAVLRLTVIAEMPENCQVSKVENVVEYGAVQIGGRSHICPLKSVSLDALTVSNGKVPAKIVQTQLNDVSFSQYHLFQAEARVLTEADANPPPQPPGAVPALAAKPLAEKDAQTGASATPSVAIAAAPPSPFPEPPAAASAAAAPSSAPNAAIAPVLEAAAVVPTSPPVAVASQLPGSTLLLRANANLVLVDVVVTERGAGVHGLDRSLFRIYDDGHERTITSFDEHRPEDRPGSDPGSGSASGQAPLPAHTYTNVPRYREGSSFNVLLLDALNTPIENQAEMRRQLIEYLTKAGPGASSAVFTLSSRLQLIKGFTTNSAELISAVESRKQGMQQSDLLDPKNELALNPIANELVTGGKGIALVKQQLANVAAQRMDVRVRMTLDALNQLAGYLGGIPGRKNLIWLSGSFPIALDPNDQLIDPTRPARQYSGNVRHTDELLAAARVTVYPIDARGVMTQTSADASYRPPPNIAYGRVNLSAAAQDDRDFQNRTESENAAMERIADDTGGKASIHNNDLKSAIENAMDNGSSYYTVGYTPPADDAEGKYHKIRVRIEGKEYNLAYRNGYYKKPAAKSSTDEQIARSAMVAATTFGAPPATQVRFTAHVLDGADALLKGVSLSSGPAGDLAAQLKQPAHRCVVELTIDAHSISIDELPDGKRQLRVEVAIVAFDPDGRRVNFLDRNIAFSVAPEQLSKQMADGIRARVAIDVPPGSGTLRIGVEDLSSAQAGSLEVPIPDEVR